MTIQPERIQHLNEKPARERGDVLYWMQQSQRAEDNHALEYAVRLANETNRSLRVVFGLMQDYPEANLRHYRFMLEGIQETQAALADRGISMTVQFGHPSDVALDMGRAASVIVCDRGYLRHQEAWRRRVAEEAECRVIQVESDVVVPVDVASRKAETAARTFRGKVQRHLDKYLIDLRQTPLHRPSRPPLQQGVRLDDIDAVLGELKVDRTVRAVTKFHRGGTAQAKSRFHDFIGHRLAGYKDHRNQPQNPRVSYMSMYLHFGQISPLYLALQVRQAPMALRADVASFLDELVVRRELSMNFCRFTADYDRYECIPRWAKKTLEAHKHDRREHLYAIERLEAAETHDPYWNAACRQMLVTGYMHNHMRMYWGKKILEWSRTPEEAHAATLHIMNRYYLDGRDANSYSNTAWIFGLHDRPWGERPIFGKVRYMAASGLERKFDVDAYVRQINDVAA
ncbi:MAG: deoxyribodipyrimidine photolyase [Nitrospira sp. SG-bin1]|nr:MAG: deoxyribodipyrimidine photolyase [Nitrospira sp. SG-bin1]